MLLTAWAAMEAVAGTTPRVSVASDGTQSNGISAYSDLSADGRYVAFLSSANNLVPDDGQWCDDSFVHDRLTGETTRVSVSSTGQEGHGPSVDASISAEGRYVTSTPVADTLGAGDDSNLVSTKPGMMH